MDGSRKGREAGQGGLAEECGYNFGQCGYPHVEEESLEPMELIRRYQQERAALNAEIDRVLAEITAKLGGNVSGTTIEGKSEGKMKEVRSE